MKVPELEKFPETESKDGAVTLPAVILKFVVEALSPNVQPPEEPLKVTAPKVFVGEVVAITTLPEVVAVNVIICAPGLNMEVELALSDPAMLKAPPKVIIDEVALPFCPAPTGRCKLPSTPAVPEGPFPEIVTAPPGANSEPAET